MPTKIRLRLDSVELEAELDESPTGREIAGRLPLEFTVRRWCDEYYGSLTFDLDVELAPDARDVLEVGELAYWPPGNAFCIFFGPTPASRSDEPRAASNVNPFGRIASATDSLRKLGPSARLRIERI